MTIFQFIKLLRGIHGKKLPNVAEIQKMGLLAVKIGQHYALRVDFLDQDVCRELTKLYRHTDSVNPADLDKLIANSTPEGWSANFADFERQPFASASIGQVHHATLKSGEKVIVKLIREDFREKFLSDLKRLRKFLKFCMFFYPKLKKVFNPLGILDSIQDYTLQELDLRDEIKGQQILSEIYSEYKDQYPLPGIRFHRIYPEFSGERVLVAEEIHGPSFDELLDAGKIEYEELLHLFNIHGFYMFVPGTYHGDIHPGNILREKDGTIVLVDTGAISHAARRIQRGLFDFFDALTKYDYDAAAECLNKMAVEGIQDQAYRQFQNQFRKLYRDFKGKTVSDVSLTRKMMETIKLGVHSGMKFDDSMFPVIKSLMYMDGMVLRCKPDADLISDLRPFIEKLRPLHDQVTGDIHPA